LNWTTLYHDFLNGRSDAIQAIFSALGLVVTLLGVIYVAINFHQQKKINKAQQELNRLAMEKDRRELFPWFTGAPTKGNNSELPIPGIIYYGLYLKDNKALDATVFKTNNKGEIIERLYLPASVVVPSDDKPFIDNILINYDPANPPKETEFTYLIIFTDQIGRPYYQKLGYNGDKVVLLYPQAGLIKDPYK
jgi:hypothetical protein